MSSVYPDEIFNYLYFHRYIVLHASLVLASKRKHLGLVLNKAVSFNYYKNSTSLRKLFPGRALT